MTPTRRRRRRTDWRVMRRIQDEALSPAPPAGTALQRRLEEEFGDAAPSLRTTQDLLSEFMPADPGAWWSLADGDPEDAVLVLPVIAALARQAADRGLDVASGGMAIPQGTAHWLVRIRTAASEMPLTVAWSIASRYATAKEHNLDTRYLDLYLALELWRSPEQEAQAVAAHLIPANWWYVGPGGPAFASTATGTGTAYNASIRIGRQP